MAISQLMNRLRTKILVSRDMFFKDDETSKTCLNYVAPIYMSEKFQEFNIATYGHRPMSLGPAGMF